MTRALIVVDIQNDYFPGGAHPLEGPEEAAGQARHLLDAFRGAGEPVVHLQHVWDEPDAAFMRPGTAGRRDPSARRARRGRAGPPEGPPERLPRHRRSRSTLRGLGVDAVVVCGMMTSMCVDATVRAAVDLGFDASVAHDACATCDLGFGGRTVPAADVHTAFLAALADGYARVAARSALQ